MLLNRRAYVIAVFVGALLGFSDVDINLRSPSFLRDAAVVAQSPPTMLIRPPADSFTSQGPGSPPTGFANSNAAIDSSETSSPAYTVLSSTCVLNCTFPQWNQTEWHSFPAGYIPLRLEVKWQAYGSIASAGQFTVRVEYSTGGGFQTLEEKIETSSVSDNTGLGCDNYNCDNHWATVNLSSSVNTGNIRVRAYAEVRQTSCPVAPFPCWEFVTSGVTMKIYDIRIVAAPPELSVSADPVTRGETATFTIVGAPDAAISNWQFDTGTSLGVITRTTNTDATTWTGTLVAGGTGKVRVVLQSNTYDLTKTVSVAARTGWLWSPVSATKVPNGTFSTLVSPPQAKQPLGEMEIDQPYQYTYPSDGISDDGPNHGLYYVQTASDDTTFRYQLSPDLENSGSAFRAANCGQSGFIDGAVLLANTIEHESGTTLGHYQQYVAARDESGENVGSLLEGFVAKALSDAAFETALETMANTATGAIRTATISESACNSDVTKNTSCISGGVVNYSPYASCP